MHKTSKLLTDAAIALVLIAAIIYSTTFLALKVVNSSIYRQSRIVSMLVQQESFDVSGMLENTENIDLVLKFTGALASAYINFEMIPVGEVSTFVAVFESMNDDIEIESFEYHRKDLIINGSSRTKKSCDEFVSSLRGQNYFASVEASSYESTDGSVKFEIRGVSTAAETYLNF